MRSVVVSCVASDGNITDGYGNVVCRIGKHITVICEGAHITDICKEVTEYSDGMIEAVCFVVRGDGYVMNKDRTKVATERVTGRGHVFYPGCCGSSVRHG